MSCNRYVIRSSYSTFCNWSVIPPSQSPLNPSSFKFKIKRNNYDWFVVVFFFFKSLEKYKKITNYFLTFLFLLLLLAGWACPPSPSNKKIKRHSFWFVVFFLLKDFPKGNKNQKRRYARPLPLLPKSVEYPTQICRIPRIIFLCVFFDIFFFFLYIQGSNCHGKDRNFLPKIVRLVVRQRKWNPNGFFAGKIICCLSISAGPEWYTHEKTPRFTLF